MNSDRASSLAKSPILFQSARINSEATLRTKGKHMPLGTILLIILVLLLIGALPSWPYAAAWGPAPAGILGVILIIVLILVLIGRF
jgi:Protein of unknown function (DUF3309)